MDKTHTSQREISSEELAKWVEAQGADRWWTIDNDPLLTGRLSLPCPGDELAQELRRISRQLLVATPTKTSIAGCQVITAADLDSYAGHLGDSIHVQQGEKPSWANDRVLFLRWKGAGGEWMLVEDSATSSSSKADLSRS